MNDPQATDTPALTPSADSPPRTREQIQSEYEQFAKILGHKVYQQRVLADEIPEITKKLWILNQEAAQIGVQDAMKAPQE